ncbi:MAG: alpha/beta hydrolase [Actinobacteria bacterium]|nr:alpha/beta hydrolase [Actinomycetota bacterium]
MAPAGTSSANPDQLDAFVRATAGADDAANRALAGVAAVVDRWNGTPNDFGGRVGSDLAAVERAVDELAFLDVWVGRVASAFRDADRFCPLSGCGPVLLAGDAQLLGAGPPSLAAAIAQGRYSWLFTVVRDGGDGRTRVVRLNVDTLPSGLTSVEWEGLLESFGLVGGTGPLQLVVHGWSETTDSATRAGLDAADLYDQQQVRGATVLVVDWAAGRGAGGYPWYAKWKVPGDFSQAEEQAKATGDALAPMFSALATANPDARVAVAAHSLGNHVALRALSEMEDPSGRFSVDYTGIQPAIPDTAPLDDPAYGALTTARVDQLELSINNGDGALFWYELTGPEALGDEAADSEQIREIMRRRSAAGVATTLVDQDNADGDGHLSLDPARGAHGLVRSMYQEQIDRVTSPTGASSPQTSAREWLYRSYPGAADWLMQNVRVQDLFDMAQAQGRPVSTGELRRLVDTIWADPHTADRYPEPTPAAGPVPPAPTPTPVPPVPSPAPGPVPVPPTPALTSRP